MMGLVDWVTEAPEHEDALRADLLRAGLRLADLGPTLDYEDAWAFTCAALHDKTTSIYRVMHGHGWGQAEAMQADLIDRIGNLMGIVVKVQGRKWRELPEYPRPKPLSRGARTHTSARGDALPIEDVLAWVAEQERPDHGEEEAG